ncbi:hypothetical protein HID58_064056, partial [Brassica napus]
CRDSLLLFLSNPRPLNFISLKPPPVSMMAGTKRRNKTGKSAAKTPSPLPSQYTFVPRSTAPLPLPNRRSGPSVSDYPPPAQLFQTSTAQPPAASDPVRQAPPPPRPRGSQTSATEQSPPCKLKTPTAHNLQKAIHPTLSEDQMRVLNGLLSQPGRERYTQVLSPTFEPGTTCWSVVPTDDDNELFLKFLSANNPMYVEFKASNQDEEEDDDDDEEEEDGDDDEDGEDDD